MRCLQRVGYATVGIEIRGIPPFAKSAKDGAPGDLQVGNAGGRLKSIPYKGLKAQWFVRSTYGLKPIPFTGRQTAEKTLVF